MHDQRHITIRQSPVMGRLAVMNTAVWLAAAGVGQLLGFPGSRAITEIEGREFDIAWALCLITGAVLVVGANFVARVPAREGIASILEIGGAALMVVGLLVYLAALFTVDRMGPPPPGDYPRWLALLEGRLVLGALVAASVTNTAGRVVLLTRRLLWAPRLRDHA